MSEDINQRFYYEDRGVNRALVICDGVTEIFNHEFENIKDFDIIDFPNSLVKIGDYAFAATSIYRLSISDSVKYIGSSAFYRCRGLKTVKLPKYLKVINSDTFKETQVTDIVLPEALEIICEGAFIGINDTNGKLKLKFPSSLRMVGSYAFDNSAVIIEEYNEGLEIIDFPGSTHYQSVKPLPNSLIINNTNENDVSSNIAIPNRGYTIEGRKLIVDYGIKGVKCLSGIINKKRIEEVVLPDTVIFIAEHAFSFTELRRINFPKNLQYIGKYAFLKCPLEGEIVLPKSIRYIGYDAIMSSEKIEIPYGCICNNDCFIEATPNPIYSNIIKEDNEKLVSLGLSYKSIQENIGKIRIKNSKEVFTNNMEAMIKIVFNSSAYNEDKDLDTVEQLISVNGFDINSLKNVTGILLGRNCIKTIIMLIRYGYDYENNNLFNDVCRVGLYELAEILILLGVDINRTDEYGLTPLMIAANSNDMKIAKLLVENGANKYLSNSEGVTALSIAKKSGYVEMEECLNNPYKVSEGKNDIKSDLKLLQRLLGGRNV